MNSILLKISGTILLVVAVAYAMSRDPDDDVRSAVDRNAITTMPREFADDDCVAISEADRWKLSAEAGQDLATFVEQSVREMHSAQGAENQLRVISGRFDSVGWSRSAGTANGDSSASLNYSALFLARYHRVLENGLRQEESALRAFHWQPDVQREIREVPLRAMVRGYSPYVCSGDDQKRYGCERGETLYRLRTLLSPRIACRFPDKRSQYAADFWVRVPRANQAGGGRPATPRILEVEVNGERLVKATYDEFAHRELLNALAPDAKEALTSAGLDPLRARTLWQRWQFSRDDRRPASK